MYKVLLSSIINEIKGLSNKIQNADAFKDETICQQIDKIAEDLANINPERSYMQILENLPIAIGISQSDGEIIFLNECFTNTFDYQLNDIPTVGHWFEKAYPDNEYRKTLLALWNQKLELVSANNKEEEIKDVEIINKTGNKLIADIKFNIVSDYVIVIFHDQTKQIKTSRDLFESKELYKSIFDNSPLGLFQYNPNGYVERFNDKFIEIMGLSGKLHQDSDIFKKIDNQKFIKAINLSLSGKEAYFEDEYKTIDEYKRLFVKAQFKPIFNENNTITGGVGIIEDNTENYYAQKNKQFYIHYLESINRISRIINRASDVKQMTSDVVKALIGVFNCTRSWLIYPVDPNAKTWRVLYEFHLPEWEPLYIQNVDMPIDEAVIKIFNDTLNSETPVVYNHNNLHPWPLAEDYSILSQMNITLRPKTGKPWMLGLHQCDYSREWSKLEIDLFAEISQRVADSLTNTLLYENLAKSEKEYRSLFNNLQDVYYKTDKNGIIIHVSPSVFAVFGYKPEECIGLNLAESFYPDPKMREEFLKKLSETGKLHNYESILKRKDGKIKYVSVNSHFYYNEKGEISGVEGMVRDISEKKASEQAVKNSEEKYKTIVENINDGFLIHDFDGSIMAANETMCEITGYTKDGLIGKNLNLIGSNDNIRALIRKIKSDGESKFEDEITRKDGKKIPVSTSAKVISYSDKGMIQSFTRDISNLKEIENNLRHAKEKAEESDRLKSAFLANMSHEIRTPMNGIIGFASLLDDDELDADTRKIYINVINSSTNQLLNIISDIVDISKIEAGILDIKPYEFELNSVFDEIYTHFENERNIKNKHSIELICKKAFSDADCRIITDETRIRQILDNLLSNALKFTNEGVIEFGYRAESNNNLLMYVKDTGIGVSKQGVSVIFDRFRQEDSSKTKIYGGTGLGLTICQGIVQLMNGKIWVESEKGMGATFYVSLPVQFSETISNSISAIDSHKDDDYNWRDKNILIVDDNSIAIQYLSAILRKTGVRCLSARTGTEAVEKCLKLPEIDLVLMDIQLPDFSGYEATKKIKKNRNDLPIIAQTANAMAGDKEKSLEVGCDAYIAKPVDRFLMLELISKFVNAL